MRAASCAVPVPVHLLCRKCQRLLKKGNSQGTARSPQGLALGSAYPPPRLAVLVPDPLQASGPSPFYTSSFHSSCHGPAALSSGQTGGGLAEVPS